MSDNKSSHLLRQQGYSLMFKELYSIIDSSRETFSAKDNRNFLIIIRYQKLSKYDAYPALRLELPDVPQKRKCPVFSRSVPAT